MKSIKILFVLLAFVGILNGATPPRDFGDAPDSYPKVSHKISDKLYLGNHVPDAENTQQSSSDATGDGADDNDGVISLPPLKTSDNSFTVPVKVFNNTGEDAYITAWIDFNRNGKFEFNEALNVNDLTVPSSTSTQTINVVWDSNFSAEQFSNLTEGKNIMRIRLTTSRVLTVNIIQMVMIIQVTILFLMMVRLRIMR